MTTTKGQGDASTGEKEDHLALAPDEEEAVAGALWHATQANKLIVPRHGAWRRRPKCRAKQSGAARPDAGSVRLMWQLCHATIRGVAAIYAAPCSIALQKRVNSVK
jgi:hypothetical protein